MDVALQMAREAGARGEVPVGAALVRAGELIAAAGNEMRGTSDPTAHAEMVAIREAARRLGRERLADCDLYVTLEPCAMCAGAIVHARIRRLYFGAADPKAGAVENGVRLFSTGVNHRPDVYGGLAEGDCARLLTDFFRERRALKGGYRSTGIV